MKKLLIALIGGVILLLSLPATASSVSYSSPVGKSSLSNQIQFAQLDMAKAVGGMYLTTLRPLWDLSLPFEKGASVSSHFGPRNGKHHDGIDFPLVKGALIFAVQSGWVSKAQVYNGYGNVVEITHGDGVITRYGHLSSYPVSVGDRVSQGDVIGASGNTGISAGPHLHFEIRVNGVPQNPYYYLPLD